MIAPDKNVPSVDRSWPSHHFLATQGDMKSPNKNVRQGVRLLSLPVVAYCGSLEISGPNCSARNWYGFWGPSKGRSNIGARSINIGPLSLITNPRGERLEYRL